MARTNSVYRYRNNITFSFDVTIIVDAIKLMGNKWPINVLLRFDVVEEYLLLNLYGAFACINIS